MKKLRPDWPLGFLGFFFLFAINGIINNKPEMTLWFIWVIWFIYFIPVKAR